MGWEWLSWNRQPKWRWHLVARDQARIRIWPLRCLRRKKEVVQWTSIHSDVCILEDLVDIECGLVLIPLKLWRCAALMISSFHARPKWSKWSALGVCGSCLKLDQTSRPKIDEVVEMLRKLPEFNALTVMFYFASRYILTRPSYLWATSIYKVHVYTLSILQCYFIFTKVKVTFQNGNCSSFEFLWVEWFGLTSMLYVAVCHTSKSVLFL